ncbi:MAG: chemotaxis-specific protein-glutamate methyltransferase CheB [Planctomycetes bacterium]|nr:chemotaxis-specific protein-glutamate methyltransferase CheB [Planctomycetota bacterium]
MIKVLVVDDSPVAQELLVYILQNDPKITVIGRANNGKEALTFLQSKRPDIVVMDIQMPEMDGIEATRRIMETNPLPIIMVSSFWNPKEKEKTFIALDAGAVAFIEKPGGVQHQNHETTSRHLTNMVKLLSNSEFLRPKADKAIQATCIKNEVILEKDREAAGKLKLIAIGASTGGPQTIQMLLKNLNKKIPVPVLIVQHIAPGFVNGMVEWLAKTTSFAIHVAHDKENALPGHVYFAPDGHHMGVKSNLTIFLENNSVPENGVCPSASFLFRSVAENIREKAIGVLLTGMGKDGAQELKMMRERGAITIAQDKNTSIVYGMPAEAKKIEAATHILPIHDIPVILEKLTLNRCASQLNK